MYSTVKRALVGRPLATAEQEHQRIPKTIGLAVFSSDAISSTAYATQEILAVTAIGASSLALGLDVLVPIAIAVAVLLAIVVSSYRQTIHAYPKGGGSYIVSKDNLGEIPSLIAGASILVDYILTVAVSISAGVLAIISIPALSGLADDKVPLALGLVTVLTLANLRGLKESGRVFAIPTYGYVLVLSALIIYGLARSFFGELGTIPLDEELFREEGGVREVGGQLGLFLILKGFSSGAVALTGVEAIADGVPAFRKPEAKNASQTLITMAIILGSLFLGTAMLGSRLHPYPTEHESAISQMGRTVFGEGPVYLALQFATAAILVLAANTAYADFPRLSSIIARDGYLPRQLANRGDRLVFSNGILFLAAAAALLLVLFDANTTALIPLYAVGVFTSFTLSQLGMFRYLQRHQPSRWRLRAAVSAFGACVTFGVLLVVATTKFTSGAWVPFVVVPAIIAIFLAIRRHYRRVSAALEVTPSTVRHEPVVHTVVVLVGRVHKGVIKALMYAKSLRPNHLVAVYVAQEDDRGDDIERQWREFGFDVALEIVNSPYRDLVDPVERFLDDLDARWRSDTITVVIPEFVVGKWYENALHGQSALALKVALLYREGTVVTSVPFHVGAAGETATKPGERSDQGDRPDDASPAATAEVSPDRLV